MENFVTVEKDDLIEEIPTNVWNKAGGANNKWGWRLVAQTPPEVQELKKKSVELKPLKPEGETPEIKEPEIKELKAKGRPKVKA